MLHAILWYTWHNLKCLTLNKNHQVIHTYHSTLEILFWVYCFCTVALCFSTCIKWISFEEQDIFLSFLSVVNWFYFFLCSWISYPCLYFCNNSPISFFVLSSSKNALPYNRFSFMLYAVFNLFSPIKMNSSWLCNYYKLVVINVDTHYYHGLIKLL